MAIKLTATDFKEPLLKVLGILTENKADLPIDLKTIYPPVCDAMKITIDQFGDDPSSGKPRVEKWIQWAFKDYKKNGYTKTMGRGQWALTNAGVQIMMASATTNSTKIVQDAPDTLSTEQTYHNDAYIRTLAAEDTKCFGGYAPQSPTCKNCPLSAACVNAMMAELVSLSKILEQEDIAQASKSKTASVAKSIKSTSHLVGVHENVDFVLIHQTSLCSKCGKTIQKRTKAWWVSAEGVSGLYHPECFDGKVT